MRWKMRLIDAAELKKRMCDECWSEKCERRCHEWLLINDAPTVDTVPVVRCKDCKWYENDGYHTNCQIMRFCVEDDDYCSRGERRKDETD